MPSLEPSYQICLFFKDEEKTAHISAVKPRLRLPTSFAFGSKWVGEPDKVKPQNKIYLETADDDVSAPEKKTWLFKKNRRTLHNALSTFGEYVSTAESFNHHHHHHGHHHH